jgi:predicted transcriptional regulator
MEKLSTMQTAKQEVMELLKKLPDNSSLEEIQYHLYVRQKIQKGLQDVERGKVHTQKEVEKRMEKWTAK